MMARGGSRAGSGLVRGVGGLAVLTLLVSFVVLAGRIDAAARTEQPDLVAPAVVAVPYSDTDAPLALAEFSGRPIVLHFGASWQADAREQATLLERLSQDYTYRDQAVAVLGIAAFDTLRPAKDLVRGLVLTYPNGFDADGDIARQFGVTQVPTTFFINRDGQVVRRRSGALTEAEYRRAIAEIVP
jgi:cytochrome c biogenesis protein CcmG/thiol:disulfide interchange protein DsbE